MNNYLQSMFLDILVATGHVETCAIFKTNGLIEATSLGYEVRVNNAVGVYLDTKLVGRATRFFHCIS